MAGGKTTKTVDDWQDVPSQQAADDWQDVPSKFESSLVERQGANIAEGASRKIQRKPVIVPPGLQGPPDKPSSYMPSTSMWAENLGAPSVRAGIRTIAEQPSLERKLHGAHQITSGMAGLASPGLAPAVVANPIPALARLGAGILGQQGVTSGLNAVGVPQGYSEAAGDLVGLGMSGVDPKTVGEIGGSIPRVVRGAATSAADAIKQKPWLIPAATGAGEILGGHQGAAAGGAIGTGLIGIPAAIRGGIEAYRNPLGPSSPYPTWRPNPNIASKTAFGGSGPSEAGNTPGQTIPRRGPPPLAPEVAEPTQAPVPFKPNPRIAAKTRFGGPGPSEAGNTPGTTIPRRGPPPVPDVVEPAPAVEETIPHEPYKPNPNIKRLTRYGGKSAEFDEGASGLKRGRWEAKPDKPVKTKGAKGDTEAADADTGEEIGVQDPLEGQHTMSKAEVQAHANSMGVDFDQAAQQLSRQGVKITWDKPTGDFTKSGKPIKRQALGGVTVPDIIPKLAKGGIIAPIPKRSKPGRMSSRGNWYGPPGSTPYQAGRHG